MLGLVIAGMFSATMSMLSSDYNVCAGVLTNDVYRRLLRSSASGRELVLVGRLMTLLVGAIALAIAFLLVGGTGERMFRNMVTLFSIASAPVGIPMIMGLFSRRATNTSALAGFLAGLLVGLILFVALKGKDEVQIAGHLWQKENLLFISSALVTFVVMMVVSVARPMGEQERNRVAVFHRRLGTPIGGLDEDRLVASGGAEVVSPFRVVGILVVCIALMLLAVLPWVGGGLAGGLDLVLGGGLLMVGGLMAWRSGRPGPRSQDGLSAPLEAVGDPSDGDGRESR